jgi:hypothetical protein
MTRQETSQFAGRSTFVHLYNNNIDRDALPQHAIVSFWNLKAVKKSQSITQIRTRYIQEGTKHTSFCQGFLHKFSSLFFLLRYVATQKRKYAKPLADPLFVSSVSQKRKKRRK